MVNEVEFSNFLEILDPNYPYSDKIGNPIFNGSLSDSGKTFTLTVKKPLPPKGVAAREILLYFGNVDFESKLVDYVYLESTDIDVLEPLEEASNRQYVFDLGKVLEVPRKIYNTQGTSEITIELYTYEANLNTDYGTKHLSVPYTIWSNNKYAYDQSTDGVYRMYTVEYAYWSPTVTYGEGDIVYFEDTGGLVVSLSENNTGNRPDLNPNYWAAPTDEDKLDFAYGTTKNQPVNAILTDILITRYAKYEYIRKSIQAMSYKQYDDNLAAERALLLQLFREQALIHLTNNKPISAAESLQHLKLAYSNATETTEIRTYNIKYTL